MLHIYNKISDYIMVVSYVGEIIFCNQSFLNRLNYNEKDILNLNINEITKNIDINNIPKDSDEKNTILQFYTKSKEIVAVNSSISIQNFNNEKNIFIIGKEVESKPYTMEMLEELLDNINICTFILNNDGKYLYVNKLFTNILNKKRDDIIGTYNYEHWEQKVYDEFEKHNKEVFENKSPKIFNEKVRAKDNTHWYESYRAPIFDENNKPKYIVATTKNINLSKTISEELYKNYNMTTSKSNYDNKVNLNTILNNIGQNVLDYTGADGMSIFLYDRDKESLIPTAKLKDSNKYLENIEFIPLKKRRCRFR